MRSVKNRWCPNCGRRVLPQDTISLRQKNVWMNIMNFKKIELKYSSPEVRSALDRFIKDCDEDLTWLTAMDANKPCECSR